MFDVKRLFGGEKRGAGSTGSAFAEQAAATERRPVTVVSAPSFMTSTGDDYEDFLQHMKEGKRPFRKPGITVKQEFELFLAHRTKAAAAAAKAESIQA